MPFPAEHGIDLYGHTKTVSAGDAAETSIREGRVVKVFNEF